MDACSWSCIVSIVKWPSPCAASAGSASADHVNVESRPSTCTVHTSAPTAFSHAVGRWSTRACADHSLATPPAVIVSPHGPCPDNSQASGVTDHVNEDGADCGASQQGSKLAKPAYSNIQAGTCFQSTWACPWLALRGHPKAPLNWIPGNCTTSLDTCQPSTSSWMDSEEGPSTSSCGRAGAFHLQVSQLRRSTERW